MPTPISIVGIASVSALGLSSEEVWNSYLNGNPLFTKRDNDWVSSITPEAERLLEELVEVHPNYARLDRTVLLAMLAARKALSPNFKHYNDVGVNIGSSRGATRLFETYFEEFRTTGRSSSLASPTTTLGNVSSWVAQDLEVYGPLISHSVTCSTALHAVLNAIAWLEADMAEAFVVGGSEAPLTPFTIAQMKSLKLYSKAEGLAACEALHLDKKRNTMVLGEGAGIAILEKGIKENATAFITGYGFGSERLTHNVSISESAICFQESMQMALQKAGLKTVDAIVTHTPGTVKGDLAEYRAIQAVFGEHLPMLTSNKWIVGHTLGASGLLSLEMAVCMLRNNHFVTTPFFRNEQEEYSLSNILVNAVGFGGNAVSIIVSKN